MSELKALLEEAATAPPETRIELRDPIAKFGPAAVEAVRPWTADARLGSFAVRVLERAASYDAKTQAIALLRDVAARSDAVLVASDAAAALARIAPGLARPRKSGTKSKTTTRESRMAPEELIVRRIYKRRELHLEGLGGNWQSGISYPADGTYVLLFSDPEKAREHGYNDQWSGDHYLYYGQWTGTGDMVFEVGNRAIVDRKAELYLFVAAKGGYRFEGRFQLVRHEAVKATRDGREFQAIVFELEPLPY
jgi:hypothetical protein